MAQFKNWDLQNDEPTEDLLAFWVPRLVHGSKSKNMEEQIAILAELRQRFGLPEHHLSCFGSVALLSGLILAHFKLAGERTPLNGYWVRTDIDQTLQYCTKPQQ